MSVIADEDNEELHEPSRQNQTQYNRILRKNSTLVAMVLVEEDLYTIDSGV
jgi:hypothetical protein